MARPDMLTRVNGVVRMLSMNCQPTWRVWVETFRPAATQLIWSLTEFSKRDILKMRAGISYRCGVRQLLKEVIKSEPILADGRVIFLFEIDAVISRALWYFFIAETFTEFAFNWTTLAMQEARCIPTLICNMWGHCSGNVILSGQPSFRVAFTADSDTCHLLVSSTVVCPVGHQVGWGFGFNVVKFGSAGTLNFDIWVVNITTGVASAKRQYRQPTGPAVTNFNVVSRPQEFFKASGVSEAFEVRMQNVGSSAAQIVTGSGRIAAQVSA